MKFHYLKGAWLGVFVYTNAIHTHYRIRKNQKSVLYNWNGRYAYFESSLFPLF